MTTNKIKLLENEKITLLKEILGRHYKKNKKNYYNLAQNKDNNDLLSINAFFPNFISSAVLCLLEVNNKNSDYNIILTKRSENLRQHSGQISFPGGKLDEKDKNFIDCAYREASEEIGFNPKKAKLVGKLKKYFTGTGFLIQPIVSITDNKQKLKLNKKEVDQILHFPINYLLLESKIKKIFYKRNNIDLFYYSIKWKGFKIWGATAKILIDLVYLFRKL